MVKIMSHFAANAGSEQRRPDPMTGDVADCDIAGIGIEKANLAIIAPDGFNGDIADVHMNTIMADGLGQQGTVNFGGQSELPFVIIAVALEFMFRLGKLPT